MANPPITIGELIDVPAPGSPIGSAWSQEVTGRSVHRFTTTAARDAAYPANVAGRGAICVVGQGNPILYVSNGSTWVGHGVWSTWSPGFTNIAPLGTSTYECMRSGDQAYVRALLNIGAGGVTGWPSISLPYPAKTAVGTFGSVQLGRAAFNAHGLVTLGGGNFAPVYQDPAGATLINTTVDATHPWTWGQAGDSMLFIFNYQAQPIA